MKNLSDGYRNTLGMIADIAYRMAILNPQLLGDVLQKTPGIILIDEVDLHLHPRWQERIIGDLQAVFPQVQFIVSTHAPAVISSVRQDNLRILSGEKQSSTVPAEVYGKDANSILTGVMDASPRPAEIQSLFGRFYQAIDSGELEKAARTLDEIEYLIGAEDPELVGARVSLALERI